MTHPGFCKGSIRPQSVIAAGTSLGKVDLSTPKHITIFPKYVARYAITEKDCTILGLNQRPLSDAAATGGSSGDTTGYAQVALFFTAEYYLDALNV